MEKTTQTVRTLALKSGEKSDILRVCENEGKDRMEGSVKR